MRAQTPIDLAIVAIPRCEPLVGLLEVAAVEEASGCAQGARVDGFENQVLLRVDLHHALAGRDAPGHEHSAASSAGGDEVNDLLCETFPPPVRMAVGLVGADCQAGVQEQNATVRPGREEAATVGWWDKRGEIVLETGVHVPQGTGCWRGWSDGEGESVRLVIIVIRVLAQNDDFDVVEWSVTRPSDRYLVSQGLNLDWLVVRIIEKWSKPDVPRIDVFPGWEDFLACSSLPIQESLEVQEFFGDKFSLQMG